MPINKPYIGKIPKVHNYTLSDGLQGNIETIQIMKRIARYRSGNSFIRALALKVLEHYQVDSQNHVLEALALGDFVKNKVIYRRDPTYIEQVQDPLKIAIDINNDGIAYGDCDDMATFLATLLLSVGFMPYFRAVRYEPNVSNYNHIYVVVYDTNWGGIEKRVVLDPILKRYKIGTEVPHYNGDEFSV